MRSLVELVIVKLQADVTKALHDDYILAHLINETISFERELRNIGYRVGDTSCFEVVTQESCFSKWLYMEKQRKFHFGSVLRCHPNVTSLKMGDLPPVTSSYVSFVALFDSLFSARHVIHNNVFNEDITTLVHPFKVISERLLC